MDSGLTDAPIKVAVLCGTDDAKGVVWEHDRTTGIVGNNDLWRLVEALNDSGILWGRFHLAPNYFRQQRRWRLAGFHVALNLISDADQNPKTLAIAEKLVANYRLPVINHPSLMASTQRHRIAALLQGIPGLVVPKVLLVRNPTLERVQKRCEETGFRFPVIVRVAGTHTGEIIGLFDRVEDIEGVYGDRRNEYFLIEYLDLRFPDGLFRKTRFFVFGDRIIPRQHIISQHWNIHGSDGRWMRELEHLLAESRRVIHGGFAGLPSAIQTALGAIRERIRLDCFGIDGCMTEDNRLAIFEVNATMNFLPPDGFRPESPQAATLEPASEAMRQLILAKLATATTPSRPAAVPRSGRAR